MRPLKSNDREKTELFPPRDRASWKEAARRVEPLARTILNLLLFSAAFYLAYAYGMSFHHVGSAPYWPPDAVLLCALLLAPRRNWWLYLLAPLPIRFLAAVPPDLPVWFLPAVYLNDSLKAIISATLLRRLNHGAPQLTGLQELFKFFAVAVLGVPILSASAGAAARLAIGDAYWPAWQRWFLGNALANLLITPMILYWVRGGVSAVRSAGIKRYIEGLILIMALILVGFKAFSGGGSQGASSVLIYLPFPLLLYAAVRFGPRGISSALSLITGVAIWNAEMGRGPFSAQATGGDILSLQLFLCVISAPLLCLSALLQERQRVGEALRESEARFRNMADNAPVMVWMTDPDGVCVYLSQSWYENTGQTPETGLGFGWVAALHPDDRGLSEKNFLAANEKREAFRIEYRLLRKDGKYRWVTNSAVPRFDSQGGFLGYIGSVVDITETKHAELNTQFINQLNFALSQTADADEIIRLATSRIGEYLGVTSCYIIEVDCEAGLGVVRENWDGWFHDTPNIVGEYRISDYSAPELIEALKAGQTVVVKDVTGDPRTRDFAALYELIGVGAFVFIPALNKDRWEASLIVNYLRARDWRPDEIQLLRDIFASLWPAFKRARALEALRKGEEALRKSYARIEDLARRLIAAQEEERRHIARELHDDLNQQVAALAIGISRLKRQLPPDAPAVHDLIAKLRDKTEQLSEHIRQVSHELHSSILQHVGLPAALNSYCAEFSDREGIAVTLDIQDGLEPLPSDMALCLYRVAQESLHNVSRHSGARRAVVTLTCVKGVVELRVADQGVGFDPGQARDFRGLGLVSMEERVKLLRGSFVLTARPGAGTELRAQIPLRREHEQAKSFVG